jgi:hypothetical protein
MDCDRIGLCLERLRESDDERIGERRNDLEDFTVVRIFGNGESLLCESRVCGGRKTFWIGV